MARASRWWKYTKSIATNQRTRNNKEPSRFGARAFLLPHIRDFPLGCARVIRKFVVVAAVGLLASLPAKEAASGSIAFVSVPLAKVVSDSRLIVIASVEQVETFIPTTTRTGDPGIKYFAVRIEEVLKSTEAEAPKNLKGSPIVVFDPQEVFYHEHADMIAAGVISFVDPRYPTNN
jgi:hypothetical protein